MTETSKNSNRLLRDFIRERGLSLNDVATALGCHPCTVSHKLAKDMPTYQQKEIIKILRKVRHDFTKGAK